MAITRTDVEYVANLARLELTDAEKDQFVEQLGRILHHVDTIQAANVEGVEPYISAACEGNVFREDVARPSLDRVKALQNAPLQKDGAFRVPQVVE